MEVVRMFDRDMLSFENLDDLKEHMAMLKGLHQVALRSQSKGRIMVGLREGERVELVLTTNGQ